MEGHILAHLDTTDLDLPEGPIKAEAIITEANARELERHNALIDEAYETSLAAKMEATRRANEPKPTRRTIVLATDSAGLSRSTQL